MSITLTHEACGQRWAVVPGILKAHPGHPSETTMVSVPQEDIYGNKLGGDVKVPSAHWISDGPSATMTRDRRDPFVTKYLWACLCGVVLEYATPAYETVWCQACTQGRRPVSDIQPYLRPMGSCSCCGLQGSHQVRVDRKGNVPACLTP